MSLRDRIGYDAGGTRLEDALAWASVNALHYVDFFEPNDAEIHYLAHNVDECRYYFEAISSAQFGWAFTVNHANLVPEGINGFIDAFGIGRIGEVRLADNLGDKEVHLNPGEGNIDFVSLFTRLESAGHQGHYMMAFGDQADNLVARDFFEQCSRSR